MVRPPASPQYAPLEVDDGSDEPHTTNAHFAVQCSEQNLWTIGLLVASWLTFFSVPVITGILWYRTIRAWWTPLVHAGVLVGTTAWPALLATPVIKLRADPARLRSWCRILMVACMWITLSGLHAFLFEYTTLALLDPSQSYASHLGIVVLELVLVGTWVGGFWIAHSAPYMFVLSLRDAYKSTGRSFPFEEGALCEGEVRLAITET